MKKFLNALRNAVKAIKLWRCRMDYKAAVKKANYLHNKTFKIHMVLLWEGKYVVVEKQHLKRLFTQRKFKKDISLKQVYSMALYTTTL